MNDNFKADVIMEGVIPPHQKNRHANEVHAGLEKLAIVGMAEQRTIARESIVNDFMWNLEHPGQTREFVKMCDGIREIMKGDFKPRARNFVFVGTELREI